MSARRWCNLVVLALVAVMVMRIDQPHTLALQADSSINAWNDRLEKLRPSEPLAYFELAEEIADMASDEPQRELARHLFGLAGALDPDRLGRSACLALADLEENPVAKRRLLALAGLLGSGADLHEAPANLKGGTTHAGPSRQSEFSTSAVLAVTEALSRYRRGQGALALTALKAPGARELLEKHQRILPGGLNRFLEDCKHYRGQHRPTLSLAEITRMLRFESALLAGGERSWSSELLLSGGQPLIEVDPDRLAESLDVDGSKPLYRNGRWIADGARDGQGFQQGK